MLIVIVQGPEPVMLLSEADVQIGAGPVVTAMLLDVGAVQPAGTTMVACEPKIKSLPDGDVKVNVNVFPVLPAATIVGLATIVPSPLLAFPASVNEFCACNPERLPTAVK